MREQICTIPLDLIRGSIGSREYVEALAEQANYGLSWPGTGDLRDRAQGGKGIKVGVVDTGVSASHPDLKNLVKAKDFSGSSRGADDLNGHGTHCCGTVAAVDPRIGAATQASLYMGKGLSDRGAGSMTDLLNAIEWCLSEGCRVVSNSWGGGTSVDPGTDRRLREWAERGIWLIFAGGNSGPATGQTDAPGNSEHVLNVAAVDFSLRPASFSSAGSKIDTSAAGVGIWSCAPGGKYQQMSGTSMACPMAAGILTLFMGGLLHAGKEVPDVYSLRKTLTFKSMDVHDPGRDRRTGPGTITPALLLAMLDEAPMAVVA